MCNNTNPLKTFTQVQESVQDHLQLLINKGADEKEVRFIQQLIYELSRPKTEEED